MLVPFKEQKFFVDLWQITHWDRGILEATVGVMPVLPRQLGPWDRCGLGQHVPEAVGGVRPALPGPQGP
jgi:hypothetical protein